MKYYAQEFKASVIAKMLPPNNGSVPEISRDTGIPKDTLYTWRRKNRHFNATDRPDQGNPVNGYTSEDKYTMVVETAGLNEAELSTYCRRNGVYPEQITAWKNTCQQANRKMPRSDNDQRLKAQARRIKELEADLRHKEKALAETAALLVLQKRVRALWGASEDGNSTSTKGAR